MGFIKRLFGLEKEVPKPEAILENPATMCSICNQPIGEERWKRIGKIFMHKKCFKKRSRDIVNGVR